MELGKLEGFEIFSFYLEERETGSIFMAVDRKVRESEQQVSDFFLQIGRRFRHLSLNRKVLESSLLFFEIKGADLLRR